jgi:hypothetical protein
MVQRERDPGSLLSPENIGVPAIIGGLLVVGSVAWASLQLGTRWAGTPVQMSSNPLALMLQLAPGDVAWPRQATYVAILLLLAIAATVIAIVVGIRRRRRRRTRVDHAAQHLGRGRDIEATSRTAVNATRLGVVADTPGVLLGRTVSGDGEVFVGGHDHRDRRTTNR